MRLEIINIEEVINIELLNNQHFKNDDLQIYTGKLKGEWIYFMAYNNISMKMNVEYFENPSINIIIEMYEFIREFLMLINKPQLDSNCTSIKSDQEFAVL
jgi:hypothetical protein